MAGTTPPGPGYWDRPINIGQQATAAEELAEDSLRDLGLDWQQPADWDERWP
jgi:hypothetical protein